MKNQPDSAGPARSRSRHWYEHIYFQVLAAILIGILLGYFQPKLAAQMRPLGDLFIRMIKMVIAPIIFCTVVGGVAGIGQMKKAASVGLKALIYFEVLTTLALAIGMVVANVFQPGAGIDVAKFSGDWESYAKAARQQLTWGHFLNQIAPDNVVEAFAKGEILQVLFFSILFGLALSGLGEKGKPLVDLIERLGQAMFRVIGIVMRFAPIGAFGAMAYTVGAFGIQAMLPLAKLMAAVYTTMFLFIFVVLGAVCKLYGFSLFRYLAYIKEEIFIVLGTSSSETVLPQMMEKMEKYGCDRSVVGLVIPTGYSFNLDGTSIYLSMAAIFIAQAFGIQLSLGKEIYLLAILMLTSKGAAAVTGGGFITLAATFSATGILPVQGLVLLFGVDRFMSEARAITNLIGNGIATIVVAKMERQFHPPTVEPSVTEAEEADLKTTPLVITAAPGNDASGNGHVPPSRADQLQSEYQTTKRL
jgi:aerobic C4-dicarboxylate transport protein